MQVILSWCIITQDAVDLHNNKPMSPNEAGRSSYMFLDIIKSIESVITFECEFAESDFQFKYFCFVKISPVRRYERPYFYLRMNAV